MSALPPLRILQVLAPARYGGLESVVAQLAKGLVDRGHAVALAATLEPDGETPGFLAELVDRGVTVETIRVRRRAYRAEARALGALASRHDAQLLHSHGPRSDWLAGRVARRSGLAAVSTVHGFIPAGWKGRLGKWLQLRALRRLDAVVAVSTPIEVALRAAGLAATRLHRLANAFDPGAPPLSRAAARRELELPGEAIVVGFVGRLGHEKGPDVLLDAVARLGAEGPQVCFVGDGPEAPDLKRRASALGLDSRVHWAGAIPGAARLLPAFDAFTLPSRSEGTPMVLFEALAAGVPAVVTLVGGVPDVVGEAEAWRVAGEDPPGLAAALAACLSDPGAARERALRGRARLVADFGVGPWLEAYEALYREALGGAGSSASPASLTVAGAQE